MISAMIKYGSSKHRLSNMTTADIEYSVQHLATTTDTVTNDSRQHNNKRIDLMKTFQYTMPAVTANTPTWDLPSRHACHAHKLWLEYNSSQVQHHQSIFHYVIRTVLTTTQTIIWLSLHSRVTCTGVDTRHLMPHKTATEDFRSARLLLQSYYQYFGNRCRQKVLPLPVPVVYYRGRIVHLTLDSNVKVLPVLPVPVLSLHPLMPAPVQYWDL